MGTRQLRESDIGDVAEFVAQLQADPRHHVVYLAADVEGVRADLDALDPPGIRAGIASTDGAAITGMLVPEVATTPPRVWWLGPFVDADPDSEQWHATADALYEELRGSLPAHVTQEELAVSGDHGGMAAFAVRHGFTVEEASLVLRADAVPDLRPGDLSVEVSDRVVPAIAALHEDAFPGTHRTAADLVGDERILIVARAGDTVVGYAAAEIQPDGDGYLDFLAVDPARHRSRIGRRLVAASWRELAARGVPSVHLTVRAGNAAARALYRGLGFVEGSLAVPYRRGFSLRDAD